MSMLRRLVAFLLVVGALALVILPGDGAQAANTRGEIINIQQSLIRLGYSPGTIDGVWGGQTEREARKFISDNGLDASRIFVSGTLFARRLVKALNRALIAQNGQPQTAPPQGSTITQSGGSGTGSSSGSSGIQQGSGDEAGGSLSANSQSLGNSQRETPVQAQGQSVSGSGQYATNFNAPFVVRRAETQLARMGYDPGLVDGRWTQDTSAAAHAFAVALGVAGEVVPNGGEVDRSALAGHLSAALATGHRAETTTVTSAANSLGGGATREDIHRIEELLALLGYDPGQSDGVWDVRAAAAAHKFARTRGLNDNYWRPGGRISPTALLGQLALAEREHNPQGVAARETLQIERLLSGFGYDPGEIDGRYDFATNVAVRQFLRSRGRESINWRRNGRIRYDVVLAELQEAGAGTAAQPQSPTVADGPVAPSTAPGETADSLIQSGAVALLSGKHGDALAAFSRALELDGGRADAHDYRGRTYLADGDTVRAIADFTRAIELDSSFALAHANRATAYERDGNFARALEDRAAALRLEPGNARYQAALSQTAQSLAAGTTPAPASAPTPSAIAERRVALVIGNSRYEHAASLRNPQGDARAVAEAFERLGFSEVTLQFDLGREALISALRTFGDKASVADWAVVYFAGHGFEIDGVNYLVPVDARLERDAHVRWEAIALDDLLSSMEGARKLRLAILDACRNNPFTSRMQVASTRSVGRGLGLIEPEGGTLVAYAARHGQVALDGDGANSPYVSALLQHLTTQGLEINLLFRRVRDTVRQLTGQAQEPYVYGSLPSEELYFNPGGE